MRRLLVLACRPAAPAAAPRKSKPGSRPAPPSAFELPLAALRPAAGLGLLWLMAGCATFEPAPNWPRTGDPLVDGRTAVAQAPAKDRVLWQCRTAATALRRGEYAEAKALLDEALLTMGSLPAQDKSAQKSRGLFHPESRKTFRGEPYERVMAYYYRGMLYWMEGEADNARACFRSAQLQDSDAETKQYANDYVLLDYLDGLATVKLAGDGADAFSRAQAEARLAKPPPYDRQANVLVFVEFGSGPLKFATGEYAEQLRFRPGSSMHSAARVKVNGQTVAVNAYDDLSYQATTRGGRVMDHILGNKAVFKSATDAAGNAALIGGMVLATGHDTREAGLGLAAAGLLAKIVSSATTPAADTRCWDNLPQYLGFAALRLPPGPHTATVEFLGPGASPMAGLSKTVTFSVHDPRQDTVIFVSDKSQ